MKDYEHKPVLLDETIEKLNLAEGDTVIDATTGLGGHSEAILQEILPSGQLIAIDQDPEALERAQKRLSEHHDSITFVHGNFQELDKLLKDSNITDFNKILFDLGPSSMQFKDSKRGFSFQKEGPLDMRMNPEEDTMTAADLVNELPKPELQKVFEELGEESPGRAQRVAEAIAERRDREMFTDTKDLADTIEKAIGRRGRLHPATRFFMALRIVVNDELNALRKGLQHALNFLAMNGRVAVITFHSLEDRIVKRMFQQAREHGIVEWINKNVITPDREEIKANPSARSAKLRVVQKVSKSKKNE